MIINQELLSEQLAKVGIYALNIDYYFVYDNSMNITGIMFEGGIPVPLTETGTAIFLSHDGSQLSTRQKYDVDLSSMVTNVQSIPNWATWTPDEAQTNVTNSIFGGTDEATLDSQIDSITTIAQVRTSLKQIVSAIITIRTILGNMAKILLYIRKFLVDNNTVWRR